MFDDIFNFGKVRTLKQSIGFAIFYGVFFMGIVGFIEMLGL